MKYYKVLGKTPEEDGFISAPYATSTPEEVAQYFNLKADKLVEISMAEFDEAIMDCFLDTEFDDEELGDCFLEDRIKKEILD